VNKIPIGAAIAIQIKPSIAKAIKAKVQIARVVKPTQIASLFVILFL
jgi:hypothetical protein